jgi:hypothetical protein
MKPHTTQKTQALKYIKDVLVGVGGKYILMFLVN